MKPQIIDPIDTDKYQTSWCSGKTVAWRGANMGSNPTFGVDTPTISWLGREVEKKMYAGPYIFFVLSSVHFLCTSSRLSYGFLGT